MGFRDRIADWLLPERKAAPKQSMTLLTGLQLPNQPIYGDMTVEKATREGYKVSVYVYRCVRTIVQAASGVPWIVLDRNGEQIGGHDFELLMKRPNPQMSGQDVIELLVAHLLLPGNALWQPLIVNGRIREVWPVMPDLVKPVPSRVKGEWLSHWEVTTVDGIKYDVPPETFIHFMQFDPGNPYWGIGPLLAAARTIDTDNEAQDTQKVSMQNRATPDGIFVTEGQLTQEEFDEANRQIREKYTTKTQRRAPWVMGNAKWQQLSLTPVEMDYIASRLANKQDIAAAFGLDPWWLGDKSTSTYNNVSEARKALYEVTIIPMLDDIKATMNLRIAPMYGDVEIAYDLSGIAALRDDYAKKAETANHMWSMGVPLSQLNDVLELGLVEFDGWDKSYLPFSVMPIGAQDSPDETTGGVGVPPKTTGDTAENIAGGEKLNGIQIQAALEVINNLISGQVPPTVALELLVAVGIDRARAQAMITAATTFEPEKPDPQVIVQGGEIGQNPAQEEEQAKGQKGQKATAWSEEQKAVHWRRIDTRRQAYWPIVAKRVQRLYGAEGDEVVRAVQNAPMETAKHQAEAAIDSLRPQWEKNLTAASQVIMADFGNQVAQDLGAKAGWRYDPFSSAARQWLMDHITKSVGVILQTDKEDVSALIDKGMSQGDSMRDIAETIREYYGDQSQFKAMRTARTEVGAAAGYGQRAAAEQSGIIHQKSWMSARDDRVRDSHQALDGQERRLDEAYSNGLMYPCDTSGDPAEFIQCRCVEKYG